VSENFWLHVLHQSFNLTQQIFQNDIKEWKFEDLEKEIMEETNISNRLYLRQYSWKPINCFVCILQKCTSLY
jgi:hypothetical protein